MLKKYAHLTAVLILFLLVVNCAKRGTPIGGAKDEEPPEFVNATPPNYSTNFDGDEIRILFNEFIKLKDLNKQLIVSPPMDPKSIITPQGSASKFIKIDIQDTLTPNTTYVFNFGNSVVDNNEGNPLSFFKYVMSTGDYIDSLTVIGKVRDALLREPDKFVTVMLYEVDSTYKDSVIYKEVPRYVTNTLDSLPSFLLTNLKAGTYRMAALKDEGNNYTYQPDKDKIAFLSKPITVPTDSFFTLTLFKEEPVLKVERPKQTSAQRVDFGFAGNKDSITIDLLNPKPVDFESLITHGDQADSLKYWYRPKLELDSLIFKVSAGTQQDTFYLRSRKLKADSLFLTAENGRGLKLLDTFRIKSSIPIVSIDSSKIDIRGKDSLKIGYTYVLEPKKSKLGIYFKTEENQEYPMTFLPGALIDFYGNVNDTLKYRPVTKQFLDYGEFEITLKDAYTYPYIVQLITEKGDVKHEQYATEGETVFKFDVVESAKYYCRIIVDRNKNGRYDTGDYLKQLQPETIIYYPQLLEIRAGRFLKEIFTLTEGATDLPPEEKNPDRSGN